MRAAGEEGWVEGEEGPRQPTNKVARPTDREVTATVAVTYEQNIPLPRTMDMRVNVKYYTVESG